MITKSLAAYNVGYLRGENLSVTVLVEVITVDGLVRAAETFGGTSVDSQARCTLDQQVANSFSPMVS